MFKGMEMPKGCLSCFVKAGWCPAIRKRMEEASRSDRWIPENYRHDDCPLADVREDMDMVDLACWYDENILYPKRIEGKT